MTAPLRRSRPYVFWGQTTSLCETCLALVPAKIEIRDNEVWYQKRCPQHGTQTTLVSSDAAYWKLCKDYIKPGDRPLGAVVHREVLVEDPGKQFRAAQVDPDHAAG